MHRGNCTHNVYICCISVQANETYLCWQILNDYSDIFVCVYLPAQSKPMLLAQDLPTYDHDGEVQWVVAEFENQVRTCWVEKIRCFEIQGFDDVQRMNLGLEHWNVMLESISLIYCIFTSLALCRTMRRTPWTWWCSARSGFTRRRCHSSPWLSCPQATSKSWTRCSSQHLAARSWARKSAKSSLDQFLFLNH